MGICIKRKNFAHLREKLENPLGGGETTRGHRHRSIKLSLV